MAVTPGWLLLNSITDVPGAPKGTFGNILVGAGKSLIAYDTWGVDNSRAAGMATFNIVSAIIGTKGAGASLLVSGNRCWSTDFHSRALTAR